MKIIPFLLFFFLNLEIISALFCFPACGNCTAQTYDKCSNNCQPSISFSKVGTLTPFTCVKTPYNYYSGGAKWQPVGVSADIPNDYNIGTSNNVSLQYLNIDTATRRVCANDGLGGSPITYSYFGNMRADDVFYFNHSGVTGTNDKVNYFMVRVMYGFITLGDWTGQQKIITSFLTNSSSLITNDFLKTNNVSNPLCLNPLKNATYRVVVRQWRWNYNSDPAFSTDPLEFQITTDVTDTTKRWGIMNVVLSVRLCHPYCLTCTGDGYSGVCNSCNYQKQPVKKSGKTCYLTCAAGYGDNTTDPLVCILCKPLCKYCFNLPQYCMICNTPLLLFKNTDTNYSCLATCPTHYYANLTGNASCLLCDSTCLNCTSLPTRCTACNPGTYLFNFQCLSICPDQYYPDQPTLTCKPCDDYCFACSGLPTHCTVCDVLPPWISYLKSPNTCTTDCGDGFYADNNSGAGPNQCKACDNKCLTCATSATYCFTCNTTFYLLGNTCGSSCPFPEYFPDNATWKCLDCATHCVNMSMNVYWKNSLREELVCDLVFTSDLNWGPAEIQRFLQVTVQDPITSIQNFNLVYEAVAPNVMRLTVSPKGYAFIYNATFHFKTIPLINDNYDFAANMYRFSANNYGVSGSMIWFLIKAPSLSNIEKQIMDGVSGVSTQILSFTTQPYIQEIKKTGIFAIMMSGAQITSTACLINTIPSQNFYEGIRFWSSFVMFDAPAWQEDSNHSKHVMGPKIQDLIQNARLLYQNQDYQMKTRMLFDSSSIDWRFKRTGYTTFFIYDTYINLSLIALCWILLIAAHCLLKNQTFKSRILGYFYSFTIRIHEITIFYTSISTLLEWIYFDAASLQRWLSFGSCLLFNLYFLAYQLYIYYDMIKYPKASIGNKQYDYYSVKYGSLLKNVRFVQYQPYQKWSIKDWFRPYNYRILSFYKNFLMMISLPIFYETKNAQISVLLIIQIFQILRFLISWPYNSKIRNIIKLTLQCLLMLFFMSIIIQSYQMTEIMQNNPSTLEKSIEIFYKIGWIGFAACWIFNLGNVFIFIYDFIVGCIKTNRQMMDQTRKQFYIDKIQSYETLNQDIPLSLVNKWVKLGNLNDKKFQEMPELNLKVESISVRKSRNGFEIELKKVLQVSMKKQPHNHKQNNLSMDKKIHRYFTLTRSFFPQFYLAIEDIYNNYIATCYFGHLNIKTFLKIDQAVLKPGEKIKLDKNIMTQKVELVFLDGKKKIIELQKLHSGFPIKQEHLKGLI